MVTIPIWLLFPLSNLRIHQRKGVFRKRHRPLAFLLLFSLINIHQRGSETEGMKGMGDVGGMGGRGTVGDKERRI